MSGVQFKRESKTLQLLDNLQRAQTSALKAEAQVYRNALKRALRGGNKGYIFQTSTGNVGKIVDGIREPFYQGILYNSIFISEVSFNSDGGSIRVGTPLLYALYWEIGHHNIFTRNFERDDIWQRTFDATRQQALDAYYRVFGRAFKGIQFSELIFEDA